MVRIITSILLCVFCNYLNAQQFLGKKGEISFFSEAPMENISAINKHVNAVYDATTKELVFQLRIEDFVFPKKLMQEHFNENYLESDIYPLSTFDGKIINSIEINDIMRTTVSGDLMIHGVTNFITVEGDFIEKDNNIYISAAFSVELKDYDIDIPKIVFHNIAETIDVSVKIKLEPIK